MVFFLVGLIFAALYLLGKYRHFKELDGYCADSLSDIDAFLKRKYTAALTQARSMRSFSDEFDDIADELEDMNFNGSFGISDRNDAEAFLKDEVEKLNAALSQKEQWRSSTGYHEYAVNVRACDTDIENAKEVYNETAAVYNRSVSRFPGSLLAKSLKLKKKELFVLKSDI